MESIVYSSKHMKIENQQMHRYYNTTNTIYVPRYTILRGNITHMYMYVYTRYENTNNTILCQLP